MNKILILTNSQDRPDSIGVHQNRYLKTSNILIIENTYDEIEIFISNEKIEITIAGINIEEYSYIYLTYSHINRELSTSLAVLFEIIGINYSDPALAMAFFGGKLIQIAHLKRSNLPIPKSYYLSTKQLRNKNFGRIESFVGYPFVFKNTLGHQGEDNYLISNQSQLSKITQVLLEKENSSNYICQEFIPNDFDYRLLVLKDNCSTVLRRIRQNKNDFRNNSFLGGKEEFEEKSSTNEIIREIAIKAAKALKRDIAGVDIIVNKEDGKPFLIEVNPFPGITFESKEEEEIVKYFISEIKK